MYVNDIYIINFYHTNHLTRRAEKKLKTEKHVKRSKGINNRDKGPKLDEKFFSSYLKLRS